MQRAVYLLSYPILWGVARLPFPLLYALSDTVFLILFYLVRYRRKVVQDNLALVYPERPENERKRIEKQFYRHLCDMFLEMIKTMAISSEEMDRRFQFENLEVVLELERKGRSIMIMMPHYAGWEWALSIDKHIAATGYGVYQPLNNRYFDKLVRRIRTKWGSTLIPTKETRRRMAEIEASGELAVYGFMSDQSPMLKKTAYWGEFMGIPVPMHTGSEELCKKLNLPVVFLKPQKLRRGFYKGTLILITDQPRSIPDFGITDAYFRETEKSIAEAPEYYFWTHKRWKHRNKKPENAPGRKSNAVPEHKG